MSSAKVGCRRAAPHLQESSSTQALLMPVQGLEAFPETHAYEEKYARPHLLWTWYRHQGSYKSLQRGRKGKDAAALRKFLRKEIESVLVSGCFLQQTEEALGPAKPASTPPSTGRLLAHSPQAAQSCSVPGSGMQHSPLRCQEFQGGGLDRETSGSQIDKGPQRHWHLLGLSPIEMRPHGSTWM